MKTNDMKQRFIDLIIIPNSLKIAKGLAYYDNDDYDTLDQQAYNEI